MFIYKFLAGLLNFDQEVDEDESDYDPHLHRNVQKPTTYFETFAHMIKGSLGAGVLAIPYGIAKVGLITGVLGLLLITTFGTYCLHILIKAQYRLCKRKRVGYMSYPESMLIGVSSGPKCFKWSAKLFPCFVDSVLAIWQLGIGCIYVVFLAENVKQLCDSFFTMKLRLYMCIIVVPLIIIDLPRDLKFLAPFSAAANLVTITGLFFVYYYLLKDMPKLDKKLLTGEWLGFPIFFGITLFALEAVGVILALEYKMERPARFVGLTGLFNFSMAVIFVLYLTTGVLGFLKFGKAVEGSVTLNLPMHEWQAKSAKAMMTFAVLLSYPLQNYVAYEIIWRRVQVHFKENQKTRMLVDYIIRVGCVLITFVVAVSVPTLGPFIGLFGAFCLSLLGIVFPCILDICVRYPSKYGRCKFYLWRDWFLGFMGIVGLLSGSYTSILDIVADYDKIQ